MVQTTRNVACTICGCVCDDLAITVEAGRVTHAEGACVLAEPWFRALNSAHPPVATIDGRPAELEDAYARAADLLHASDSTLIYGLSRSTTDGQRAATDLAECIGATIDTTASTGHAPSWLALQEVGESTCTLGEVRNRADLVIYWGSDPVLTHPRHLERYSLYPTGRHIPRGRKDRYLVVVDDRETETAKLADLFIQVPAGQSWEAFESLRMLVKGIANVPAAHVEQFTDLARRMKACRCGVIFFGVSITREPTAHRTVASLLQLVTDLNMHTRFYARRMRRFGDVAGADAVLSWQTCYPFGVNFFRGYPRYNPGEFTGPDILARKEADACVLVGSETAKDLPPAALAHLKTIPVILLDPPGAVTDIPAAVRFTTAVYGVHRPGTAYRLDEVPIPLRVLLPTTLPSDGDVLNAILARVG